MLSGGIKSRTMKKIFIMSVLVLILVLSWPKQAGSLDIPVTEKTIPQIINHFAKQYNVSAEKMLKTLTCESNLNPRAIGDHGKSFGIAQIHLPSHPYVSVAQAQDPIFATEFMAKEFARGNAKIWTCYRIHF